MPQVKVYRFNTPDEVESFVNGSVVCRTPAPILYGIVGKTLKLTTPAGECLFEEAAGQPGVPDLHRSEVYRQIIAAIAGLTVTQTQSGLVLTESDPQDGVEVDSDSDPEVLAALGLPPNGSKGTVYTPAFVSPAPPCFELTTAGPERYDLITYVVP